MKISELKNDGPSKEAAGEGVAADISRALQKRIDRAFKLDQPRRDADLTRFAGELPSHVAANVLLGAVKENQGVLNEGQLNEGQLNEFEESQSLTTMLTMVAALADQIDNDDDFEYLFKELSKLEPNAQFVAIFGFGPRLKEAQAKLAFDIAENWEDRDNRVRAYGALAPVVDGELLSSLLVSTLELESSGYQLSALNNMVDSLPKDLAAMAFDGVGDKYGHWQGLVMRARLLRQMDTATRNDKLVTVQRQARDVADPFWRGEVLSILHHLLAKELQGGNLRLILAADEDIEEPYMKINAYFRSAMFMNSEEARERHTQAIELAFTIEGTEHHWALQAAARGISNLGKKEGSDHAEMLRSRISDEVDWETQSSINRLLSWEQTAPDPESEDDPGALERTVDKEVVTDPQLQAEDFTPVETDLDKASDASEASDEPPPEEGVIAIPSSEEGVEAFTQASYSGRARSGLRFAAKLAKLADKPIDSVAILCGLLINAAAEGPLPKASFSEGEDNGDASPSNDSPRWLWQHLVQSFGEGDESSERVADPIRFLGLETEFGIDTLPKSGAQVSPPQGFDSDGLLILTRAGRIAQDVSGLDRVSAHHLLGALLTHDDPAPRVQEWLRVAFGSLADQLGQDLLNARMDQWEARPESIDLWRELLARQPLDDPAPANNQSSGQQAMAGYESDHVLLKNSEDPRKLPDPLGVDIDVEALSQIAMARGVEPPMSIGLFGDWGSGKTYFMALMTQKIFRLEAAARKAVKKFEQEEAVKQAEMISRLEEDAREAGNISSQEVAAKKAEVISSLEEAAKKVKKTAYCTDVCQIHFNAWHFIDTNLWASIVIRVFSSLAQHFGSEEQEISPWEKLLLQTKHSGPRLEQAKEALEEANKGVVDAKNDVTSRIKAVDVIDNAIEKREKAPPSVQNFMKAAFLDPKIQAQLKKCADDFGIPSLKTSVEDLAIGLKRANSLLGRTLILWKNLGGEQGSNAKRLGIVLVASAMVTGPFLIAWMTSGALATLGESPFGLALTGGATLIGLILDRLVVLRSAFDGAHEALARLENAQSMVKDQATYALDSERERLIGSRELAQQKLAEANTALASAQADKQAAESIRTRVRSGAFIGDFILERSENPNYKDQLGIIDEIRNDLEGLTRALSEMSDSNPETKRLDRIILYIDDLDRCPSERVVEVLQAVHLLLAFKLFVVIVGVDSRWLLHALQEQYSAFGGVSGSSTLERLRWRTTPHNYLEKIFQIPFTLRPMGAPGYLKLINHLTAESDDADTTDSDLQESKDPKGVTGEVVVAAKSKHGLGISGPDKDIRGALDNLDDAGASVDGLNQGPVTQAQVEQIDRSLDEEGASPLDEGDAASKGEDSEELPAEGDSSRSVADGNQNPDKERPLQHTQGAADNATDKRPDEEAGLSSEQISSAELGLNTHDEVNQGGVNAENEADPDDLSDAETPEASASEEVDPNPPTLKITAHERDLMVKLDELIPTPRAAKRFVNVYRLIKATIPDSAKLAKFEGNPGAGGDYQAVMIMLGLQAGFATQAYEIFLHLASKRPTGSWWKLVEGLEPKPSDTDSNKWEINSLNLTGLSDAEAEAWRELHMAVAVQECEMSIPDDLRPFVEYATVVARFGFITGRAVVAVRDAPVKSFDSRRDMT